MVNKLIITEAEIIYNPFLFVTKFELMIVNIKINENITICRLAPKLFGKNNAKKNVLK